MGLNFFHLFCTFVAKRYTLGMYQQMGHLDLVAQDPVHFASLAVRLLEDKGYREEQSETILKRYMTPKSTYTKVDCPYDFLHGFWVVVHGPKSSQKVEYVLSLSLFLPRISRSLTFRLWTTLLAQISCLRRPQCL